MILTWDASCSILLGCHRLWSFIIRQTFENRWNVYTTEFNTCLSTLSMMGTEGKSRRSKARFTRNEWQKKMGMEMGKRNWDMIEVALFKPGNSILNYWYFSHEKGVLLKCRKTIWEHAQKPFKCSRSLEVLELWNSSKKIYQTHEWSMRIWQKK